MSNSRSNSRALTRRRSSRWLATESLESRVLLDAGLGSEIAQFESEAELKSSLIERAVAQYEWAFGNEVNIGPCGIWGDCWWPEVDFVADGAVPPSAGGGAGAGGGDEAAREPSFSDTNTQVVGVDEGDIVETDGHFIYILSNNTVTIVDVADQEHPRVADRYELDEGSYGQEMYLDGDRLMVISNGWNYIDPIGRPIPVEPDGGPGGGVAIDAIWNPGRQFVTATVLDVTDREDVQLVSETEVEGTVSNSRAIDGTGYLIVNDYISYPSPEIISVELSSEDGKFTRTLDFYETEESYRARMEESVLIDVFPEYSTIDASDEVVSEGLIAGATDIYASKDPNFNSVVSIVSIDMHAELPTVEGGTSVMMQSGHEIFMSTDSLYLFQPRWDEGDTTSIMKFDVDLEDHEIEPIASGTVKGRMLDQFSADEYGGNLRVATTVGWGDRSSSGVYVLGEDGDELEIVGSVEKLAPGERIFSARFVGETGYVVTFRQVDPLFSIDLSNPTKPVVEGELKIPGFSEYMQPIDENHLLAIGRDADPRTGRSRGLQISLFDVTDINDPKLEDRYTFEGEWGTYSAAEHDHHAFGYYPEYNTLAIPVTSSGRGSWIQEEWGGRFWVPAQYSEALQVFSVDTEEGFEFLGAVEHPSQVQRSLRVDDALYSVSYDTVKVNSITEPDNLLGQVHFLPPRNGGVIPKRPDAGDIDRVFEEARAEAASARFDMDGNALVNTDDATFLVEAVLETKFGDADLNGEVGFKDFLILANNFGNEGGWEDGDFTGDGLVDFDDFRVLAENFDA